MKSKLLLGALAATVLLGGSVFAKTAPKQKITMDEAQVIATKRISGTVLQADLVAKGKGKGDYSIFVDEGNGITAHELISAKKGKVIWVKDEAPATAKIK